MMMDPPTYIDGFHDKEAMKKIRYGRLGNTDMIVSHVGIGGCSAGGEYGDVTDDESVNTIITAVKSGINYVDTSPAYGAGKSEAVIGKALRQLPRKSFYIATKVGRYELSWKSMFDFSYERTLKSVDTSLQRLGVDYVDLIQVHDLEFVKDINQIINETLPALQKVLDQGKARFIGITGYPLSTLHQVIERSTVKIHTVLSYCRNTLLNQDLRTFIPSFQSRGLGVINASITSMSLLTSNEPPDWHPASEDIKAATKEASQLCKSRGVELARLATQFSVNTPGVAVNILGCNDHNILKLNIDAASSQQTELERELTAEVFRIFSRLERTHWEGVEIQMYQEALKMPEEDAAR